MKKVSFVTIKNFLTANGFADADVLAELDKEINRGEEQKAKNAEAYAVLKDAVMDVLTDAPATVNEIWEALEDNAPAGATKAKVQYGLTRLWKDEVVVVEGKPNGYKKA